MSEDSYVIISCVKNEAKVIKSTLDSVVSQTKLPLEWIIIDDNSEDDTREILKTYSQKFAWIKWFRNEKVKLNEKGARIASIINTYSDMIVSDYRFLAKLDGDVRLPREFYSSMLLEFKRNRRLGIASGSLIYLGKKERNIYEDLTRGATKMYRKECYLDIGGLQLTTGWDTLDNIIAQSKHWETRVLDVWFDHLEEEGASQGYFLKYYNVGKYCGKVPYHSWYFGLKLVYRIFEKPIGISTLLLAFGYVNSRFINVERPFPVEVSNYFRDKQSKLLREGLKNYFK